jgi:putative peptide zinc metalloprotease protein
VLALKGKWDEADQLVASLAAQQIVDPNAVMQGEVAREMRDAARKQYEQKKAELDRLRITAPAAGTIIPPPSRPEKAAATPGRLRTWYGTPFDDKNVGALITPTDPICIVGNPDDMEAVLVIDQAYIDLVREGHKVRVLFESNTHRAYESQIESIAAVELQSVSKAASTQAGGRLETKTDMTTGTVKPLSTSYQASAPLDDSTGRLQVGLQGQARIYTGWQPLGRRLYRFVTKTFHFDM